MIIIQGSARKNGNSALVGQYIQSRLSSELIDLVDYQIEHFSYDGRIKDDFLSIVEFILKHHDILLVTPIYWYTMSGRMKCFLDRFSDLLKWDKNLGRKLRSKNLFVISNSASDDAPDEFQYPFKLTADYLGMNYIGYCHTVVTSGNLTSLSAFKIDSLLNLE